jgi:hypothetical protein
MLHAQSCLVCPSYFLHDRASGSCRRTVKSPFPSLRTRSRRRSLQSSPWLLQCVCVCEQNLHNGLVLFTYLFTFHIHLTYSLVLFTCPPPCFPLLLQEPIEDKDLDRPHSEVRGFLHNTHTMIRTKCPAVEWLLRPGSAESHRLVVPLDD